MRRRDVLLASPLVLGACVEEGTPQTGNASPPGAGNFDWRAALAKERRAAALLLDPDRAWGLLPQTVREAAARAFPAGEGLGFSLLDATAGFRRRVLPNGGLIYLSTEYDRLNWELDWAARERALIAGRRLDSPGREGFVGIQFSIGPAAFGFDLLSVELDTHQISSRYSPGQIAGRLRLSAYVTTAIDRVEGRLDLARVGSGLLLESRRQPFSRETLGPSGPETRRVDRWQVLENVDESVVWREMLDDQQHWAFQPIFGGGPGAGDNMHLRGPHVRIRQETDGQGGATELYSRLLGLGRSRVANAGREWSLASTRATLNEHGRERLQLALSEEARLYAEAPMRARQVPATNRDRARSMFQAAFGLWQSGNFVAARRGFEDGQQIDPWNGAAHFYLQDIYRNRVDITLPSLPVSDWERARSRSDAIRREAKNLLVSRHQRLASALLPPDSREGIELRTLLSAT